MHSQLSEQLCRVCTETLVMALGLMSSVLLKMTLRFPWSEEGSTTFEKSLYIFPRFFDNTDWFLKILYKILSFCCHISHFPDSVIDSLGHARIWKQ